MEVNGLVIVGQMGETHRETPDWGVKPATFVL